MQKNTAKKNTKRVAIVGGTVAALLGGGIAFAAWTSTGTGSGSATALGDGTTMAVLGTSPSGLAPTTHVTMTVTVTNTNPYAVHIDKVEQNGDASTSSDAVAAGCIATVVTAVAYNDTANVSSTTSSTDYSHVLAPAGTTGDSATFPVQVGMTNAADNGCKGATFTIPLLATGHSVSN